MNYLQTNFIDSTSNSNSILNATKNKDINLQTDICIKNAIICEKFEIYDLKKSKLNQIMEKSKSSPKSYLVNNYYSSNITFENKRGNNGKIYSYMIKGSNEGRLWGHYIFSDDSNIAKAAVLEGICKLGECKTVNIKIINGQSSYSSFSKNGIDSSSYGSWPGSYCFV